MATFIALFYRLIIQIRLRRQHIIPTATDIALDYNLSILSVASLDVVMIATL
jgi:hypothetical protein